LVFGIDKGMRRGKHSVIALVALALAVIAGHAWAAAGALDPTFSGDGRLTLDFGTPFDYGNAVAIQKDGRIVVAGVKNRSYASADFALARVNSDGTLDDSFSGDGLRTVAFGHRREDDGKAVAIQTNGKIVVAGDSNNRGVVARLNEDGTLDKSFAGDGRGSVGTFDIAAMAIQRDGKIVVAGTKFGNLARFAVARLTRSGKLDRSFAGDGVRTISFPSPGGFNYGFDFGAGVAVQRDGRIVVAGSSFQEGVGEKFAVTRLRPHGGLDQGFGANGRVTAGFRYQPKFGGAVALQPNGKIVVAGAMSPDSNHCRFGAFRLRPGGRLDHHFSKNGKPTVSFGGHGTVDDCGAFALAIQPDGKIVMAGESPRRPGHGNDLAVARLLRHGSLDDGFSGDGRLTMGFGNGSRQDWGSGLVIQSDDRIVVAGVSQQAAGRDFALARFKGK
jgi:uncharacterized delta-60 repeat protein